MKDLKEKDNQPKENDDKRTPLLPDSDLEQVNGGCNIALENDNINFDG